MKKPEINMVPMLDVLLVLVVVLLKVSVHQISADDENPPTQTTCAVRISGSGYELDGASYTVDEVEDLLQSIVLQAGAGATVTVYAVESSVTCGMLESLIRGLRKHGCRPVYTIK
jgi:biopolymer transport protein ExbD